MAIKNVSFILVLIMASACLKACATASTSYDINKMIKPGHNLEARLQANGGIAQAKECLREILELASCTTAISEFFILGSTDITHCCSAISNVPNSCDFGPFKVSNDILTVLGYTYLESDILTSVCGSASSPAASPFSP